MTRPLPALPASLDLGPLASPNLGPPDFSWDFQAELEALFAWRRDVRHFATTPLAEDAVPELLRIAHHAPSVGHSQPWQFVRIGSAGLRDALAAHVDAAVARAGGLYDGARRTLYNGLKLHGLREAPEVMAVFCDEQPEAGHGLGAVTMPETRRYSTVMAIHTLWLAARARGIGMGWVSIVDPAEVGVLLDTPPHWHFMALLCLGHPLLPTATPELEARGWQARTAWRDHVHER